MIYIVSVILMISLLLGGIFVAAAPNINGIIEQDFSRKVNYYSKIASLHYADIALRAKNIVPAAYGKPAGPASTKRVSLDWVMKTDQTATEWLDSVITASYLATGVPAYTATIIHIKKTSP